MAPREGHDPPTFRVTTESSTNWATLELNWKRGFSYHYLGCIALPFWLQQTLFQKCLLDFNERSISIVKNSSVSTTNMSISVPYAYYIVSIITIVDLNHVPARVRIGESRSWWLSLNAFNRMLKIGSHHRTCTYPTPLISVVFNLFTRFSPWMAMSHPFGRRVKRIILISRNKLAPPKGFEPLLTIKSHINNVLHYQLCYRGIKLAVIRGYAPRTSLRQRVRLLLLYMTRKLERHVGNAPIYSSLEDSHVSINTYVALKLAGWVGNAPTWCGFGDRCIACLPPPC